MYPPTVLVSALHYKFLAHVMESAKKTSTYKHSNSYSQRVIEGDLTKLRSFYPYTELSTPVLGLIFYGICVEKNPFDL